MALHHGLQASSMYKFFTLAACVSFLEVCLLIHCSNFLQGAILRVLHAVACIVIDIHIFVSHTALLFTTACTIQT